MKTKLKIWAFAAILAFAGWSTPASCADDAHMAFIDAQIAANAGKTGVYVLDTGAEALLARAWLADHARASIDVQYFIWSADNIGTLATEALLRAADRGVRVRVIVDDMLIDAPDKSLLAFARHPNVDIRIYNPQSSVGVPLPKRLLNVATKFRAFNQRMHNKTFIVDGRIGITGGRNMAAEYFDYNHDYNFRDRDVLLLGEAAVAMRASFEDFWNSELSVRTAELYDGLGVLQKNVHVDEQETARIYRDLHDYARSPEHFAPEVRAAIESTPEAFDRVARQTAWCNVEFVGDRPGKNDNRIRLDGGGLATSALADLVRRARKRIVIQSPYLILSDDAMALFRETVARGVDVSINTNSLASTDNLQAFSGYRNQRRKLLEMGLKIHEFRPAPEERARLIQRLAAAQVEAPIFSLHAKTMVVDSETVFIGTFNFDPRSENLNTEVGAIVRDERIARAVESAIETDMAPGNSWNAATDDPDQYVSLKKRSKTRFFQLLPIKPIL